MTKEFSQILSNCQRLIGKEIEKFFEQKIEKTAAPFEREVFNWLKEYSLRPAKRIRAILVNYGYFLAGGKNKQAILQASIFIELIHNYLLIHDDIIDKDEMRRGGKTLHCLYGQDMAMGAGDMASALGYEVLTSCSFPSEYKIKAINKINQTLSSTCYGQMLELKLREKKKFTEKSVLEMYKRKTAFYTLVAPLQVGALLAGADEKFLKKIEKFALPLGIGFQIRDDIQDGDIEKTFGFKKEKYQKLLEKFVAQAKKSLRSEKTFPISEKEFLLNLADYTKSI